VSHPREGGDPEHMINEIPAFAGMTGLKMFVMLNLIQHLIALQISNAPLDETLNQVQGDDVLNSIDLVIPA